MKKRIGYLFIAPATIHLIVFALFPLAFTFYLSFFKWNLLKEHKQFVGSANYAYSVQDPLFWNALWNSFRFALGSVPFGMAVALAVAILVNQKLRGVTLFRTLYYIPAISSGVAISMLWIYMYLPESGLINTMLKSLGGDGKTDFLNNPDWAMKALVFMSVWVGLGPKMVLFLAGLIGIPQTLYEAAEIDGASRWRSFWNVTLPMLAPTTFFVLVTSTIGAFQLFTPVYMMTQGRPNDTTDVVGYHIYIEAWQKFLIGIAGAKSFVLLLVIAVFAFLQYRLMRRQLEGYSAG
jgi:multiple sugar transport system permease protein